MNSIVCTLYRLYRLYVITVYNVLELFFRRTAFLQTCRVIRLRLKTLFRRKVLAERAYFAISRNMADAAYPSGMSPRPPDAENGLSAALAKAISDCRGDDFACKSI